MVHHVLEVILKNDQLPVTLYIHVFPLLHYDQTVNIEHSFKRCTASLEAQIYMKV